MVAYAVLDRLIEIQVKGKNCKDTFTDSLKSNFAYAKELLLTVLSDTITVNSK